MKGWSDYLTPAINITHSEPFDIKLTGLFYKIEVQHCTPILRRSISVSGGWIGDGLQGN